MDTSASRSDLAQLAARSRWLGQLARTLVRDDATAQDLVQETLRAAVEHPPSRVGDERGWLARVLANVARSRARSERDRGRRERIVARAEHVAGPDELVERAEAHRVLIEELLALEEPYRATLLARFVEGESAERIAELGGTSASTVRTRLQRGLAQLRVRLERRCGRDWTFALAPLVRDGGSELPFEHAASHTASHSAPHTTTKALLMSTSGKSFVAAAACLLALLVWTGTRDDDIALSVERGSARAETAAAIVEPAPELREFTRTNAATTESASAAPNAAIVADPAAPAPDHRPTPAIETRTIEVLVRRSGQPLADVHVWVASCPSFPELAEQSDARAPLPEQRRDGRTELDGIARFAELDSQSTYLVGVEPTEYGVPAQRVTSAFVSTGGRCIIDLGTSQLRGRIYDEDGRPIVDVRVSVSSIPSYTEEDAVGAFRTTDSNGNYEFSDLSPGRHWVMMDPDELFDGLGAQGRYVDIEPGRDVVLDFGAPGGTVVWSGAVLNTHGDTLAGPGVLELRDPAGVGFQSAPLTAEGRFSVGVAPGTWAVSVRVASLPETGVLAGTFVIDAEHRSQDVVVAGARVAGRVLDRVSRAVPVFAGFLRVRLTAAASEAETEDVVRRVYIDRQGEFVFDGIMPGAWRAIVDVRERAERDAVDFVVRQQDTFVPLDLVYGH